MRERTPLTRETVERLSNLNLIASMGSGNASIDTDEEAERGVEVVHTGYSYTLTVEFIWTIILAMARCIPEASDATGRRFEVTDSIRLEVSDNLAVGHLIR